MLHSTVDSVCRERRWWNWHGASPCFIWSLVSGRVWAQKLNPELAKNFWVNLAGWRLVEWEFFLFFPMYGCSSSWALRVLPREHAVLCSQFLVYKKERNRRRELHRKTDFFFQCHMLTFLYCYKLNTCSEAIPALACQCTGSEWKGWSTPVNSLSWQGGNYPKVRGQ